MMDFLILKGGWWVKVLICLLLSSPLSAIPACMESELPNELISANVPWKNRLRRKALYNLDEVLHWSLRGKLRSYVLLNTPPTSYANSALSMRDFAHLHGYFSLFRPLVGKVSAAVDDIDTVRRAIHKIQMEVEDKDLGALATAEFLAKALAYRDLQKADRISIKEEGYGPVTEYRVVKVFHLWGHMPAFGLMPQGEGAPILLFRGTDLSLDSQRGWASLMSDVDLAGPGFYAFKKARADIHAWLVAAAKEKEKARVIGFSLGGALAMYTFVFENAWMSSKPSYAFSPPGVSDKVIATWKELPEDRQAIFRTYVNRGDVISKVGKLHGNVYELSIDRDLKPVSAHTALMTSYRTITLSPIDVSLENASR